MAARSSNAPIIVKRRKIMAASGHHGGAWKVAYADFVTAMMAFFLLMWLLNATSDQQRQGIADYFNPTVTVQRISGGGDGLLGGDTIFIRDDTAETGSGGAVLRGTEAMGAGAAAEKAALKDLQSALQAIGGESMEMERLLRHVVTKITDEGLVVELFDLPDSPLFEAASARPMPILRELAAVVTRVFNMAQNNVAIQGFVQNYPITLIENPTWDLSVARAQAMRNLLEAIGFDLLRSQRVSGFADRKPATRDPQSQRNNRLEVILLRKGR